METRNWKRTLRAAAIGAWGAAVWAGGSEIDLSGEWAFRADPKDVGVRERWFEAVDFEGRVELPGSMVSNGLGDEVSTNTAWIGRGTKRWLTEPKYAAYRRAGHVRFPFWLQPNRHYLGAAWYRREFGVPEGWSGAHAQLVLERCHWQVRVWIDGEEIGEANALGTPDVFDVGGLTSGRHVLSVRVDNRIGEVDPGINAHSVSDHTQGAWNGMVGELKLVRRPKVFIDAVRVYPNVSNKSVRVVVDLIDELGSPAAGGLSIEAEPLHDDEDDAPPAPERFAETFRMGWTNRVSLTNEYALGADAAVWDEFRPNLYRLKVEVRTRAGRDERTVLFGLREFKAVGTRFFVNGRPVFLRGMLDCGAFAQTGYPATSVEGWMERFGPVKTFGLNHVRFHSWCPPEAAFEAADRMGLYLQVECSAWAHVGNGKPIDGYVYAESERIVRHYGNHPSFCLMAYGNEPGGKRKLEFLRGFVEYWKAKDDRRVYTTAAGWPAIPESDYVEKPNARTQNWGQGLKGLLNAQVPNTAFDYREEISSYPRQPYVSHEIGEWCAFPDFSEIGKYKGVFRAKNFEIFRDDLRAKGLGRFARRFLMDSGALQVSCYKQEIESALRTPGMAGFQLLGLVDFPGQGTALVGPLNVFREPKPYVDAETYCRFCADVVPLVRLPKRVFLAGESVSVPAEVAWFAPSNSVKVAPRWRVEQAGRVLAEGVLPVSVAEWGNHPLGSIGLPLSGAGVPAKRTLFLTVSGHENSWNYWVYPSELPAEPETVRVVERLDDETAEWLKNGGRLLLAFGKGGVAPERGGDVGLGFTTVFWNAVWTHGQKPLTLGLSCKPNHPALKRFPTETHSDWQWRDACMHADAIVLDGPLKGIDPIVRIIDDWNENRSLALLFEARVGKGRLIATGIDLTNDLERRPEARQLRASLVRHLGRRRWSLRPLRRLGIDDLRALQAPAAAR